MHSRPIEGRPNGLTARPSYRTSNVPAPETWVLHFTYGDRVIWYRYPDTGNEVHRDSDYALDSTRSEYHPPYNERSETAILERHWPRHTPQWKATPWFTLTIGSTTAFSLIDQPTSDTELELWWDVITEALNRAITPGISVKSVLDDLDALHLNNPHNVTPHQSPT